MKMKRGRKVYRNREEDKGGRERTSGKEWNSRGNSEEVLKSRCLSKGDWELTEEVPENARDWR